jgi:hypothetical protein
MKKYLFILILFFAIMPAKGNIAPPRAFISEVYIDSLNNWIIELGFYMDLFQIDSIRIETSSGSARLNHFILLPGGVNMNFDSIAVVTNSNLDTSISINPDADYVKIITYAWGSAYFDYVAIGNFPGSMLDCLKQGESVSYVSYVQSAGGTGSFCIDTSPTIGFANDTTGALSTITGIVYNYTGGVFTEGWFPVPQLHNTIIHINPDGSFSERIFSRKYVIDTIQIYFPPWPYTKIKYTTDPINICLRPDTFCNQDIVTTSQVMEVNTSAFDPDCVTVSPNPFNKSVVFYFNIPKNISHKVMNLTIYHKDGKKIDSIEISPSQRSCEWTPEVFIPSGVLLYQLMDDNRIIQTGRFVKVN